MSSNLYYLAEYRIRPQSVPTLYYLNERQRWAPLLNALSTLSCHEIHSTEALKSHLLSRKPNLILLESDLKWIEPLTAIELLVSLVEVPIILLGNHSLSKDFIRRAYAAGVYDILYTPLKESELLESVNVLLRIQHHG